MSAALHTAEGWNGAQSQLREALAAHDHQDSPLPGGALDPEATLDLAELEVQRLRVAGVDVAEAARELLPSAGGTVRERMDVVPSKRGTTFPWCSRLRNGAGSISSRRGSREAAPTLSATGRCSGQCRASGGCPS